MLNLLFSLNAFQHVICEILDSRGKYLKVFAAPWLVSTINSGPADNKDSF